MSGKGDGLERFVKLSIRRARFLGFWLKYRHIAVVLLVTVVFAVIADLGSRTEKHTKPEPAPEYSVEYGERFAQAAPVQSDEPTVVDGKLNLNTASEEQLDSLPGIGAKRAKSIVETRTRMGGFRSVDDILNVEGIGEKILEKIRDKIFVEHN